MEWLTDLQKAKADGNGGFKPKTTIQDLLERINDPNAPETSLIPSSPRSVEACFRLGIDPVELQFQPPEFFRRAGEDDDIARLRYEKNEGVRQDRVRSLTDMRKMLIDENWGDPIGRVGAKKNDGEEESSQMVEEERRRLEVSKRRGEKELMQMIQHEIRRKELLDKQQRKIDELERRAQEMIRHKEENEAAWMTKQREIELQKLDAEKALELEAKRLAEERFKKEREMQQRQEEEDRMRKREAFMREMERRKKTEDARRETQAILDAQAEVVRQNKLEMDRRDAERLKRMVQEAKERAQFNEEKRKKADLRIQSALAANEQILMKKRADYEAREAANEARRKELEEFRRKEEALKREEERRKEKERHDKYLAALESEEMRKMSIKQRAEEKERLLAELYARRKKENDIRKVESEFELKLRLDKVDALQKSNLYQRQQTLDKIMSEYDKTRTIMRERNDLQRRRKMANMQAAMQRQAMSQAMDQLKRTKNMNKLTGPGGTVNVNELLNKCRPQTAAF